MASAERDLCPAQPENEARSIWARPLREPGVVPGFTTATLTHPLLSDVVELIADWDVSDGNAAQALAIKAAPSTRPVLLVQYRDPFESERQFGANRRRFQPHVHFATVSRKGVAIVRPTGPLGVIGVRLQPEAAGRLMGDRMQDFLDAKINLCDLFKPSEVARLQDELTSAADSAARFASTENFLLRNLRPPRPLPVAGQAAQRLRRNPAQSVRRLAAQLEISERHLSRSFRASFGTSPKEFSRFARLEKVVAMRRGGSAWVDIAYACGFADQAHMIRDFEAVFGESPQRFFTSVPAPPQEADVAADPIRSGQRDHDVTCGCLVTSRAAAADQP